MRRSAGDHTTARSSRRASSTLLATASSTPPSCISASSRKHAFAPSRPGWRPRQFIQDLRGRCIGAPEISTDGLHFYRPAIRDAWVGRASHGVITKTYSVTRLRGEPPLQPRSGNRGRL